MASQSAIEALADAMLGGVASTEGAYSEIAEQSVVASPEQIATWRRQLFESQAKATLEFLEQHLKVTVVGVQGGAGTASNIPGSGIAFI